MPSLRPYQQQAIDGLYQWLCRHRGNPLVVLPTGSGKSVVQAAFIQEAINKHPHTAVLCVSHVKEIIQQNHDALKRWWPQANTGICCAGLGRYDLHSPITFASIQTLSAGKRLMRLPKWHLVFIDEAHLVPHSSEGIYRTLIMRIKDKNPKARFVGLSATPYRLTSGWLHKGKNALFDDVAVDVSPCDLVPEYLCPLTSKSAVQVDYSSAKTRGGEYVEADISSISLQVVEDTVRDLIPRIADRRKALVFASSIEHADAVVDLLRKEGVSSAAVHSRMQGDRNRTLADFASGQYKALVNVNVLTTGFDQPDIDCLVLLRPTLSTGLYVQMLGRGMRKHESKQDCLVLDYAGNILRHGPIDNIKPTRDKGDEPGGRECKQCSTVFSYRARECPDCGWQPTKACMHCREPMGLWLTECPECGKEQCREMEPKHQTRPLDGEAFVGHRNGAQTLEVTGVNYSKHEKAGKPPSMRVEYECGPLFSVSEWICFEHGGYATQKAKKWWRARQNEEEPKNTEQALAAVHMLPAPKQVKVTRDGRYWKVNEYIW